jgi:predicted dehydrogenase
MASDLTNNSNTNSNRREFLKTSTATVMGAAFAAEMELAGNVHAAGSDVIRVGLIGCGRPGGGRGRGAAENCIHAGPNVKLYAMADLFKDHLDDTRNYFLGKFAPDKVDVAEERCFVGWDAYKNLLALKEVDVVILATPPGFRPIHLKAAVEAGKHVFAEKPVAVDAPGVRSVLQTCEEAKKKNLSIVSGLCWRYDSTMRETMQKIHDGGVGEIVALQCTYNAHGLWMVPRKSDWTDMEWQVRNWLYFTWLSGDHNVEQHIHSLDKMAWAMRDEYPVKASGIGGRQVRTDPAYGHIFDHHFVAYEYANGVKLFSCCRQQNGCAADVSDNIMGSKGICHVDTNGPRATIKPLGSAGTIWKSSSRSGGTGDMYLNEHVALIESIRAGKPINNGDYMTKSTLMAIMGRMATYTGQVITWNQALNSKEDLSPPKYEFTPLPVAEIAKPGVTKFS